MKLYKLIRYDFINGIWRRCYLYLVLLVVCVLFFYNYWRILQEPQSATFLNCLFYFFEGRDPFDGTAGEAFSFPALWVFLFLYVAYITLEYPCRNIIGHGSQVLIRCKNRRVWWISKCLWAALATIIYFALLYLVIMMLCLVFGMDISLQYSDNVNKMILDLDPIETTSVQNILLLVILPVLTALTIVFVQMCIGLFCKRIYSFLIVAVWLLASCYFQSPFAIGNFAMIKRSIFCSGGQMMIRQGIFIECILITLSVIVGMIRFRRYDVINGGVK